MKVHPALGRDFRPEEGRPGGGNVAILSDRLWVSRFQADPGVLGTSILIDGDACTIVGVLAKDFELPLAGSSQADLWLRRHLPSRERAA